MVVPRTIDRIRGCGSYLGWSVACLLILALTAVAYATAAGRGVDPVMSGWFVLGDATITAVVLGSGATLRLRGHHRVAHWVGSLALALALNAGVAGLATTWATSWVVAAEAAWWIVPITLSGAGCLVAAEELLGKPGSLRWGRLVPAGLAAAGLLLGFGAVTNEDVYPGTGAPLEATALGTPAAAVVFNVLMVMWMLASAIAPALCFWTASRSLGLRRGRLTITAIAATAPLLTLATCSLLIIGHGAGLLGDRFATIVLSVAFCLPPVVVAAGLAVACAARDDGVTGTIGRAARWVLRGLWIAVTTQLAALLAALLADGIGTPSALAGSTVAVVLCVVFVAAYGPVATRIDRLLQPDADFTEDEGSFDGEDGAPLSGTLSPRERDVLALIAQGRSNAAIAAELFVSERTVDSHVTSIFDKLGLGREAGANRRVQAAAAWIRAELEDQRRVS